MYQELEMWKAEQAKKKTEIVIHKDGITTTTTVDKVNKDELLSAALAECFAMNKQFTNVNANIAIIAITLNALIVANFS